MQLKNISFENFKCFKKQGLDTKKLTIITGANSSGKTSILYGFLGAIQSGEFPYRFSPNGKYVNMGDFNEMSHGHILGQEIKIGIDLDSLDGTNTKLETFWKEDAIRKIPILSRLIIRKEYCVIEITKKQKYTLEYNLIKEKYIEDDLTTGEFQYKFQSMMAEMMPKEETEKTDKPDLFSESLKLTKKKLKDKREHIKFTFNDFTELKKVSLSKGNFILQSAIQGVDSIMEEIDQNINFVSSFRLYPERTYYEKSKDNLKIGKFGENYEDQIIAWETTNPKKYKELVDILRKLKLVDNVRSRRLEGGRYEVLIRVKSRGIFASLNDVGFGISQFLPIIIADIQLGMNSTLFVAQPEIHLHPSVQASFGDYLVENVSSKNKRYVIETHSEYLLNRIRLLVAQKKIKMDDIKVYYLSNKGKQAKVHDLKFTTRGQIKNAPPEFFETYMMDVMDIANSISE